MTTEEFARLPMWVATAILGIGYSCEQIGEVRFDLEAKPLPKIDVMLRPVLPKDIEVTIVVEPSEGA